MRVCKIVVDALLSLATGFNNLIEQNVSYLYGSLEDGDLCVRKNALMGMHFVCVLHE